MSRFFRTAAYWFVLLVTVAVVLLALLVLGSAVYELRAGGNEFAFPFGDPDPSTLTELLTMGSVLISGVTAFTAVFFGWRQDRRQARDLELKTKELQIKLLELQHKLEIPSA